MNTLCIKETEDTPLIHYDPNSGIFKIEGNSIPENAYLFYDPILIWLDKYIERHLLK